MVEEDRSSNELSPTVQLYVKVELSSSSIILLLSNDIVPSESHINALSTVKSAVIKSTLTFIVVSKLTTHPPDGSVYVSVQV